MFRKIAKKMLKAPWTLRYTDTLQDSFCSVTVTGKSLYGKTVIISGATGGIGNALVKRFLLEDCKVIMIGRCKQKLQELKENYESKGYKTIDYIVCDLSDLSASKESLEKYLETIDNVDALINNAGILGGAREKRFRDISIDTYTRTININLKSAAMLSYLVIDRMINNNTEGTIINVSSICSQFNSFRYSLYGISKAGLIGLTKDINEKYFKNLITAHAILPGSVATKMVGITTGDNIAGNNNMLNRLALPEEVAAIAAIYMSDIGRCCKTDLVVSAGERL